MRTYMARIVKTYRKDVAVKAANEKEAFKYAAAKIMQGGEEEILVRTEILLDAAGPSERSER